MASRLYEILRKDVFSDIETGPRTCVTCACGVALQVVTTDRKIFYIGHSRGIIMGVGSTNAIRCYDVTLTDMSISGHVVFFYLFLLDLMRSITTYPARYITYPYVHGRSREIHMEKTGIFALLSSNVQASWFKTLVQTTEKAWAKQE